MRKLIIPELVLPRKRPVKISDSISKSWAVRGPFESRTRPVWPDPVNMVIRFIY